MPAYSILCLGKLLQNTLAPTSRFEKLITLPLTARVKITMLWPHVLEWLRNRAFHESFTKALIKGFRNDWGFFQFKIATLTGTKKWHHLKLTSYTLKYVCWSLWIEIGIYCSCCCLHRARLHWWRPHAPCLSPLHAVWLYVRRQVWSAVRRPCFAVRCHPVLRRSLFLRWWTPENPTNTLQIFTKGHSE